MSRWPLNEQYEEARRLRDATWTPLPETPMTIEFVQRDGSKVVHHFTAPAGALQVRYGEDYETRVRLWNDFTIPDRVTGKATYATIHGIRAYRSPDDSVGLLIAPDMRMYWGTTITVDDGTFTICRNRDQFP